MVPTSDKMSEKKHELIIIALTLFLVGITIIYAAFDMPALQTPQASEIKQETSITTTRYVAESHSSESPLSENQAESVSFPVNINTAGYDELISVNGIGEDRANDIIAYREANDGFESLEELTNIYGIGESTFQQISGFLTVG